MPKPKGGVLIHKKRGKPKASPGSLKTPRGRIPFQNDTHGMVEVRVPKYPQANTDVGPGALGALDFTGADRGKYVYSAYCHDGDDFAEGDSSPKIIINP